MQYTAVFHGCKNVHFQMKIVNIFLFLAQSIDCGYTILWVHKPTIYVLVQKKVGCKVVFVTRTCFRDVQSELANFLLIFNSPEPKAHR